jgi:hypothetical protein
LIIFWVFINLIQTLLLPLGPKNTQRKLNKLTP